jgi:hypothetical protein
MQKRGVFVDSEDFLPVTATYPKHPLSDNIPNFKTTGQLKEKRAADYKNDVLRKEAEFESHCHKVKTYVSKIPDEGYVANPKYTSINQKVDEALREARKQANLTDTTEQPKDAIGEPGLRWNYNPNPNTA